ncbi:MAG: S8 family peptidase, partial [Anaerolineae bacterium]
MNTESRLLTGLVLITIAAIVGGLVPNAAVPGRQGAYVEPGLLSVGPEARSVIVTAGDSAAAARAVARIGGEVTSDLWLVDAVAATVSAERVAALAAWPGVVSVVENKRVNAAQDPDPIDPTAWDGWVTDYRFPVPWDGSPDVQPTNSWNAVDLVYPVSIDLGTDTLYGLLGTEITVAVVDSGVYFDDQVKSELGQSAVKLFQGQADYVAPVCDTYQSRNGRRTHSAGIQYADHCFTGVDHSQDAFGHGTHVAGIMWNQISDLDTGVFMGVAPEVNILSVRVLGDDGTGTYETIIQGIQYVVAHKDEFSVRVLNLSLSAQPTTPYFVDPLNRAVEQAWASDIVVVAAAGNEGPGAETITVPGNDPYVITVGALDGRRTPGYWGDDVLTAWSATGPTLDGFAKPDVLAPGMNIVSFMYNDHENAANSARLVREHPDYSETSSLFRMNGTSMATAMTSGVVALMLQAHPELTPDQVKFRLMYT